MDFKFRKKYKLYLFVAKIPHIQHRNLQQHCRLQCNVAEILKTFYNITLAMLQQFKIAKMYDSVRCVFLRLPLRGDTSIFHYEMHSIFYHEMDIKDWY